MTDKRTEWIAALNEYIHADTERSSLGAALYRLIPHLTGIRDYLVNQHETQPPALLQRLAGRDDEEGFRRLAPKKVLDREIVVIRTFVPGSDNHYASAFVIAIRKGQYGTYRLVCQDDNRSGELTWYLLNSRSNFSSLAAAESDLQNRTADIPS